VDTIVLLKRDAAGVQLLARGRDIEEVEKTVTFNKQACTWTVEGNAEDVRRSAQQRAILAFLRETETPRTPIQIATGVGMKRPNVRGLLGKLVLDGSIQKAGPGKYALTPKKDTTNGL